LQLEQISVPPSNHHHGGLPARVSARFNCSTPLLDFNATIQRNSPGFHNHVVVNRFGAADHAVDLFYRAPKRFGKSFIVTVKPLISQGLDHMLGTCLIGSFVVNFLIEHRTDSVLFQIINLFEKDMSANEMPNQPQKGTKGT